MKTLIILFFILINIVELNAQQVPLKHSEYVVKVELYPSGKKIKGEIYGTTDSSLTIRLMNFEHNLKPIPVTDIYSIIVHPMNQPSKSLLIGMGAGAFVGATIGLAQGND